MRLIDVGIVLLVIATGFATYALLDLGGAVGGSYERPADVSCVGEVGWTTSQGRGIVRNGEYALFSNNALRSCLSDAGTLTLGMRGTPAAGIGAQVVIALGTSNLWEGFVTDPIELELDVPHAGTMLIAFVNDRYEPPEDRNLWISDVVFTPR